VVELSITANNDPDKSPCYADHAEDIRVHGVCDFCGSTEPNVIGHVLPDTPRHNGVDAITAARMVCDTQQHAIFDGVLLDTVTAAMMISLYDALKPANQQMLRSWPLVKVVDAGWRLTNRQKGNNA
jgi:hypothetical protein